MAGKPKSMEQDIGEILGSEIKRDAPELSKALFGDVPSGTQRLSQREYLAYVARNWADPEFRKGLRTRLQTGEFIKLAKAVAPIALPPAVPQASPTPDHGSGEVLPGVMG